MSEKITERRLDLCDAPDRPVALFIIEHDKYPSEFYTSGKDLKQTKKFIKKLEEEGFKLYLSSDYQKRLSGVELDEFLQNSYEIEIIDGEEYHIFDCEDIEVIEGEYIYHNREKRLVIYFSFGVNYSNITILYDAELKEEAEKYKEIAYGIGYPEVQEEVNKINLVSFSNAGYQLAKYDAPKIELAIETNYNDDFLEIHEKIINKLREKSPALYLFHGDPGTGKTSYLLYLMSLIGNKEIIYLSPDKVAYFSDTAFVDFLSSKAKDAVIIIEDAESILQSREEFMNAGVTSLLNLTDGIVGKLLNTQVICTFNCDYSKIDKALVREGRLFQNYQFGLLKKEKAQILSDKLGFDSKIEKDMTLAEIYNQKSDNGFEIKKHKKVGFNV